MSGSQNYTSPNFVIPYSMPSGIPDSLKPFLKPIYIAFQNIIQTLIFFSGVAPRPPSALLTSDNDPTAILANNVHRYYTQASEDIAVGAAVNLFAQIGILFVQNANATDNTKPCDGFCSQVGGIAMGTVGEVILNDGVNLSLTGLTVGAIYYLSTTPGEFTATPPTSAGNLQQYIGKALTTTALKFFTGPIIQH